MGQLLFGWWLQIWPNLAANVIWVPVAAIHHVLMKRHVDRRHQQLKDHVAAMVETAVQKGA